MCGNFGILFLQAASKQEVLRLLRVMARITMVRGAQSAGVATYSISKHCGSALGRRCRVVNGKRTDLAELLLSKLDWQLRGGGRRYPSPFESWSLFQGHTSFATSSLCNYDGCHPRVHSNSNSCLLVPPNPKTMMDEGPAC